MEDGMEPKRGKGVEDYFYLHLAATTALKSIGKCLVRPRGVTNTTEQVCMFVTERRNCSRTLTH